VTAQCGSWPESQPEGCFLARLLGLGQDLMITRTPAPRTGQQRVPATRLPPRPPLVHGPDRHPEQGGNLRSTPALHQRGYRQQTRSLLRVR
jgi:hypothetical protein